MAKESMKAREVKRQKTVAKYAEKRKALLEAALPNTKNSKSLGVIQNDRYQH